MQIGTNTRKTTYTNTYSTLQCKARKQWTMEKCPANDIALAEHRRIGYDVAHVKVGMTGLYTLRIAMIVHVALCGEDTLAGL